MTEELVYSAARSVPLKFRTSEARKAELKRLADEAGVSMQVYVEAKVFGLSFDDVRAPGRSRREREELPGLELPGRENGDRKEPLRLTG